jgi:hypothetical protein
MNFLATNWQSIIDKVNDEIRSLTHGKDQALLNWKPSDDQWSMAQILDHLIIINDSYQAIPDALSKDQYRIPFLGKINFIVKFFGQQILKSVQPNESKKSRTFPIWEPSRTDYSKEIVDDFFKSQEKLKKWINDNEVLIAENPVISSPANINIVYRFRTLLDIIVAHEQRHVLQIAKIIDMEQNQPHE